MIPTKKLHRLARVVSSVLVIYIVSVYFLTYTSRPSKAGHSKESKEYKSDQYHYIYNDYKKFIVGKNDTDAVQQTKLLDKFPGVENILETTTNSRLVRGDKHGQCADLLPNKKVLLSGHNWFTVSSGKPTVHIYSAYFDEKASAIKVMAISSKGNPRLFCQTWLVDGKTVSLHISETQPVLVPETHGKRFAPYILRCDIPKNSDTIIPAYISLVHKDKCSIPNHLLPVQIKPKPFTKKYNFTVCVTPVNRNYSNLGEFLQFIEVNAMFGADHFVLYNHSIGERLKPFIDSFINDGLLEILDWDIPVDTTQGSPTDDIHYFGQLAALNDCVYRSRSHSKYAAILDLDEIIVPMRKNTWLNLIHSMDRSYPNKTFGTYLFRNIFFRKEWKVDQTYSNIPLVKAYQLQTLLYTKREVKTFPHRHRSKYIVDPNLIDMAGIHFPWRDNGQSMPVKEEDGVLYHYRNWEKYEEEPFLKQTRMFDFKDDIIKRITNRIEQAQLFGYVSIV